jgi:PPP family 3-phenylpropionic acid transporter
VLPPRARARLAYVVVAFATGAIIPYLPLYYRSLGFSLGEVGAALALGWFVGLAASPGWGALSDRFGGSPYVFLAATATALTGAAILGLTADRGVVLLGGAVLFAGTSGVVPILDARALETAGANRTGYGPLRAWGSLSYTIAALGTGVLIDASGIRAMFAVLVAALIATGAVGLLLKPIGPRTVIGTTRPLLDAGRLFGPRGLGLFLLGAFLTWLGMSAVLTFTPVRFAELGADASMVGLGGALAAAIEVPCMLGFPRLADRFGAERLLVLGAGCIAARAVVASVAASPEVLLSASVFGGVGFALFFVGGVTYVSRRVPAELAATAQGIFQGVGSSMSNVVSAALGGSIAAAFGLQGLFLLATALGVVGTVVIGTAALRRSAVAREVRSTPETA